MSSRSEPASTGRPPPALHPEVIATRSIMADGMAAPSMGLGLAVGPKSLLKKPGSDMRTLEEAFMCVMGMWPRLGLMTVLPGAALVCFPVTFLQPVPDGLGPAIYAGFLLATVAFLPILELGPRRADVRAAAAIASLGLLPVLAAMSL